MSKLFLILSSVAVVIAQCSLAGIITVAGSKFELLPAMVLFAALSTSWPRVILVAIFGGLFLELLSSTPLGLSIPPLVVGGVLINHFQKILYRENPLLQFLFTAALSFSGSIWIWLLLRLSSTPLPFAWPVGAKMLVIALLSGLVAPPLFWMLDRISHWLRYETTDAEVF